MHTLVDKLQQDHHYFHSLIELVHRQIISFKTGATSDCQWLVDGMTLIQRYLHELHQPEESRFQDRLLFKSGKAHGLLLPLFNQDRYSFDENANRFIDTLHGAISARVSSRLKLAQFGEHAVKDLYQQILFEERAILPYANKIFDADDWSALDHDVQSNKDRCLLKTGLKMDYQNLMKRPPATVY